MGLGPIYATRKALERANLKIDDMDIVEINEAFSSQALACIRDLAINPDKAISMAARWAGPPLRRNRRAYRGQGRQPIKTRRQEICPIHTVHWRWSGHCNDFRGSLMFKKIGVVGSGVMGMGIAAHCANAGLDVVLLDMKTQGWIA